MKSYEFSTGKRISGFDELFPLRKITWPGRTCLKMIINGPEGSGKSTLALQLSCLGRTTETGMTPAFATNVKDSRRFARCVLYYVVDDASERISEKFERFVHSSYEKYPVWLLPWNSAGARIPYEDGTFLFILNYRRERDSIEDIICRIKGDIQLVTKQNPEVIEFAVVIDSIAPFESIGPRGKLENIETGMFEFDVKMPPVLILVDEELGVDKRADRDPYVSHVYIKLWQGGRDEFYKEGSYCERYLQIVKAVSCSHVRGPQFFRINDKSGIEIYPSLSAYNAISRNIYKAAKQTRTFREEPILTDFGHPELDNILKTKVQLSGERSPILVGSCSLLIGEVGTLKTPLSLYFCGQGLKDGGKVFFLSLHDRPSTIYTFAKKMKIWECNQIKFDEDKEILLADFTDSVSCEHIRRHHRFVIQRITSRFISPEAFIAMVMHFIEKMDIEPGTEHNCRVVVDAISDLHMAYSRLTEKKGFLSVLTDMFRTYGVTSLFIFNESGAESAGDKVITNLADNTFHLYRTLVGGRTLINLHIEKIANRFSGYGHVLHVERSFDKQEHIKIEYSREVYHLDERQRLVPAKVKLFVNSHTKSHDLFNEAVCKAHGLSPETDLDKRLATERGEAYVQNQRNLCNNLECSFIMAVDEDCLGNPGILNGFASLENWTVDFKIDKGKFPKDQFINIEACYLEEDAIEAQGGTKNRSLRILPSLVDCSVMVCNVSILNRISGEDTPILREIENIISQSRHNLRKIKMWAESEEALPTITWDLFYVAAKEFWQHLDGATFRFFSFPTDEDLECLVVLFLDFLYKNHIIKKKKENRSLSLKEHDFTNVVKALMNFTKAYLPTGRPEAADEMTVNNSLFYQTWHSKLYQENNPHLVPVKVDKSWQSVRGGYYWGILDNGLGGERAKSILEYASNDTMNLFRIINRVGMPPREKFYVYTGELCVGNLGLMRSMYAKSWSRSEFNNYHNMASYIRTFLHEYLSHLDQRRYVYESDASKLANWLRRYVKFVIERIQEANLS